MDEHMYVQLFALRLELLFKLSLALQKWDKDCIWLFDCILATLNIYAWRMRLLIAQRNATYCDNPPFVLYRQIRTKGGAGRRFFLCGRVEQISCRIVE
jgi:hypothetical protein